MHKEFLMGNEAIALGALAAGVNLVAGYPGTPSTEVLETIAKRNPGNVYVCLWRMIPVRSHRRQSRIRARLQCSPKCRSLIRHL